MASMSICKFIYIYIYIYIYTYLSINNVFEGSAGVNLPTIWTDGKAGWEESEKRIEEKKKEDQRRERVRGKKMQALEKVEKSRLTVVPMICGSRGSKSRLNKAAGGEPSGGR